MPSKPSIKPDSKLKSNSKTVSSSSSRTSSTSNKKPPSSSKLKLEKEDLLKTRSTSNSILKGNNKSSSKKDQNDVTSRNSENTSRNSTIKSSISSSKSIKSSSKVKEEKVSRTGTTKQSVEPPKNSSSRRIESSKKESEKTTSKPISKVKTEDSKRKSSNEKDSKSSKSSSLSTKSSSKSSSRSDVKERKSKKEEDKDHKKKEEEKDHKKKEEEKERKKKKDEKEHKKEREKEPRKEREKEPKKEEKTKEHKSKRNEEKDQKTDSKSSKKEDGNESNNDNHKIYKDEISTNAKVAEYEMKKKEAELQKLEQDTELKMENNIEDSQITNANPSPNSLETVESGISITSPNDLSDGEVEESISSRFVEVDEMEGLADDIDSSSPPSSSTNLPQSTAPLQMSVDAKTEEIDNEMQEASEDNEYLDYDDDFENYESDFDDDDEVGDEEGSDDNADSGEENGDDDDDDDESENDDEDDDDDSDEEDDNTDIPEPDPQMKAIIQAMHAENNRPRVTAAVSAPQEPPAQEPRQDKQQENKARPSRPKTSKVYVNFNRAKERAKGEKASEKIKNRGQLLQEMIQLDEIAIDLFIQISDSYESYIAAFGRSNTVQSSIQTNEDALSAEIQTDPCTMLDKWTQKPIQISIQGDSLPTPEDYLGVGGDTVAEEDSGYEAYKAISSDTGRLTKFLSAASQVILMLLEEELVLNESLLDVEVDENLGFSKSGIGLGSGLTSLLEGRKSTLVTFCSSDSVLVLTGHGFFDLNNNSAEYTTQTKENDPEPEEDIVNSSMADNGALLCVWSVHQPSFPQRILTCRSPPCVACFNPGRPIVTLAGLDDGSLAAWDFRESLASHPVTITLANRKWRLSPPSFITACSREGTYEGSAIVALETVGRPDQQSLDFGSFQVVSLSALGQITWWVLVQGEIKPMKVSDISNVGVSSELGAAPWSRITMSRAATISIDDVLHSEEEVTGSNMCYDLKLSGSDANQLFVATANGSVVHCSRHNMKMHPSSFIPEIEPGSEAVSISICPHDPLYFLVGGNDGLIRLHSVTASLPLTCWQASNNPAPVKRVEWSPSRPCVFYMLDTVGMFHIWDLSAGDIYPIISVEDGGLIGGQLVNFNLANVGTDDNQSLYAVFASESGAVGIRSISSQFLRSNEEEYKNELERFKCYVSII